MRSPAAAVLAKNEKETQLFHENFRLNKYPFNNLLRGRREKGESPDPPHLSAGIHNFNNVCSWALTVVIQKAVARMYQLDQ
jgi:hypothetical protein